jgi:hypothetical protein
MKLHAPRREGDYVPLCGAWSGSGQDRPLTTPPGREVNCPDCRTIINHIRANITEHGYRYVILERKI